MPITITKNVSIRPDAVVFDGVTFSKSASDQNDAGTKVYDLLVAEFAHTVRDSVLTIESVRPTQTVMRQ